MRLIIYKNDNKIRTHDLCKNIYCKKYIRKRNNIFICMKGNISEQQAHSSKRIVQDPKVSAPLPVNYSFFHDCTNYTRISLLRFRKCHGQTCKFIYLTPTLTHSPSFNPLYVAFFAKPLVFPVFLLGDELDFKLNL